MAKKSPVSLADIAAAEVEEAPAFSVVTSNVATLQRDNVATSQRRKPSKHTSLYLSPAVRKAVAEIALRFDKKPHELYIEGVNLMLAQYGRPSVDEIDRK